jgi:hypothetical protein
MHSVTHHIVLGVLLAGIAAPARAEDPVPIDQEPRHVLRFQNAHVRFFDVSLPPGYRGVMHIHQYDGVFVNIEPSDTEAEDWGKPPSVRPPRQPGETYFIGYAAKPKAHRVSNVGTGTYHVIDTEIMAGCGPADPGGDALSGPVIVENPRVRVTRVELQAGARATLQGPCGMLVAVSGGTLVATQPGGESRVTLAPAGFHWREGVQPVVIENAGDATFSAVDIRLK